MNTNHRLSAAARRAQPPQGFDHPGTELHGDTLQSTDPALRWEVNGRRHAAFTTDFDYSSSP